MSGTDVIQRVLQFVLPRHEVLVLKKAPKLSPAERVENERIGQQLSEMLQTLMRRGQAVERAHKVTPDDVLPDGVGLTGWLACLDFIEAEAELIHVEQQNGVPS